MEITNIYILAHEHHVCLLESAIDIAETLDSLNAEYLALETSQERYIWGNGIKASMQKTLLDRRSVCMSSIRAHASALPEAYALAEADGWIGFTRAHLSEEVAFISGLIERARKQERSTEERIGWRIAKLVKEDDSSQERKLNGLRYCMSAAASIVSELVSMRNNLALVRDAIAKVS